MLYVSEARGSLNSKQDHKVVRTPGGSGWLCDGAVGGVRWVVCGGGWLQLQLSPFFIPDQSVDSTNSPCRAPQLSEGRPLLFDR